MSLANLPLALGTARVARAAQRSSQTHRGFTLIEVLVATAVTLILMGMVVQIFGFVTSGVQASRAVMETTEALRNAKQRLQLDLEGVTAPTMPSLNPEAENGYFEYIEGPIGPIILEGKNLGNETQNVGGVVTSLNDTQVGDIDDILMFTSRAIGPPFVARYGTNHGRVGTTSGAVAMARVRKGTLAEIAWFMRGTTLYRRMLLIAPGIPQVRGHVNDVSSNYYHFDVSMRQVGGARSREKPSSELLTNGQGGIPPHVRGNTLGDLTMRENRYAHQPLVYPHESRWMTPATTPNSYRPGFGLPTLWESSSTINANGQWVGAEAVNVSRQFPLPLYEHSIGGFYTGTSTPKAGGDPHDVLITPALPMREDGFPTLGGAAYDPWAAVPRTVAMNASNGMLPAYASSTHRYDEDAILTGVISFDVKAWDPGAPVFLIPGNDQGASPAAVVPGDPGYLFNISNNLANTGNTGGAARHFRDAPTGSVVQMVGCGAYADLNYLYHLGTAALTGESRYGTALNSYETSLGLTRNTLPRPSFGSGGQNPRLRGPNLRVATDLLVPSVYDTWSTHYERDGRDNDGDGLIDEGTNRIDDDGDGQIDEADEFEAPPPYSAVLRGIQVKIRTFELDSRQIREVTLVHEFLPE